MILSTSLIFHHDQWIGTAAINDKESKNLSILISCKERDKTGQDHFENKINKDMQTANVMTSFVGIIIFLLSETIAKSEGLFLLSYTKEAYSQEMNSFWFLVR